MYRVDFLPNANRDILQIVAYISETLQNPIAASRFLENIGKVKDSLQYFPLANPKHDATQPSRHEYRTALVENYHVFYRVDEVQKVVTVTQVAYAKRMAGFRPEL